MPEADADVLLHRTTPHSTHSRDPAAPTASPQPTPPPPLN